VESFSSTIYTNSLTSKSADYAKFVLVHFGRHGQAISEVIKAFLHKLRERSENQDDHYVIFDTLQLVRLALEPLKCKFNDFFEAMGGDFD